MQKPKRFVLIVVFGLICCATAGADDDRQPLKIQARYEIQTGTRDGRVVIDCEIPEGNHIYSTTQASPPGPTKFQIADSDQFKLSGDFSSITKPLVTDIDPIFGTRLEEFAGKVTFMAPLQLADTAELEKLVLGLTINCQVCSDSGCVMVRNKKVEIRFAGYFDPAAEEESDPPQSATDSPGGKDDGSGGNIP